MAITAGRVDIADDVVAEAFSRLLVHDEGVRDPVAWLFRASFRLAARELRREGTRSLHRAAETGRRDPHPPSDEPTPPLPPLSPSPRAAVFLHYPADLPVSEVAALTGSSVAAVKVQLHRARRALRATLDVGEASGA